MTLSIRNPYLRCVPTAEFLCSSRNALTAVAIVAPAAGFSGGVLTGAAPSHLPVSSQAEATILASSQVCFPVRRRRNFPPRVPAAKIMQPHRFHFLDRSSNSPERDSSGCSPSHSWRWRR